MSALIVSVLVLGMVAVFSPHAPAAAADPSGKVVVFVTGYGIGSNSLTEIQTWLTGLGATVRVVTDVNDSALAGADAVIFGGPYGSVGEEGFNATNAPVVFDAIWDWWNGTAGGQGGGKFLWMGSDSDYGGGDWISANTSKILETVGSALRHEPTSVEDPVSNCGGGAYRVVANVTESVDPDGVQITTGVTHGALFHGPTLIYGFNGTHNVALHNNSIANVFNIMYTTGTGVIVDQNPTVPPYTVSDSQTGNFVMMAGEKDIGYFSNNRIIATGASPYGDYEPMWTDSYLGTEMNGSVVVKQAILWGLEAVSVTVPGPPSTPTLVGPSAVEDGMIQVNWTAATDDTSILRYQVAISNSSTFTTDIDLVNVSSSTLTHTFDVSGISEGTYYTRVRAIDSEENAGDWSNTVTTTYTIPTIPPPPPAIPGFPFEAIILGLAAIIVPVVVIRRRRK